MGEAEGQTVRLHDVEAVVLQGVEEQRGVAGREQFHGGGVGAENCRYVGDEAAFSYIRCDGGIDLFHSLKKRILVAKICAGVGAADRGEQGGADAVAGYVRQCGDELAVGQRLPVIVITAGFIGRLVPGGDVPTATLCAWGRATTVLYAARHVPVR